MGTYTLYGLIGGSSWLHTMPWMRRTTSSISESSVSWIPSFQFRLPPVSIGLQISSMLSVFYSKLVSIVWGFIALMLTFRKLRSCLLYWFFVFRTSVHSSSLLPVFNLISVILALMMRQHLLTGITEIVVFIHERVWSWWLAGRLGKNLTGTRVNLNDLAIVMRAWCV